MVTHDTKDSARSSVARVKSVNVNKRNLKVIIAVVSALVIVALVLYAIGPPKSKVTKVADNAVVRQYRDKLPRLKSDAQKNPNSFSARQAYGQALYVTGDKLSAKNEYESAAKLNPKSAILRNDLGNVYRDLNEYSSAVASYQKAYALDPTLINAYVNLATMQAYTLNKPADAIATYKLAVSKNSQSPDLLLLLGGAYELNNQKDLALATYRSVLSKDPNNISAKRNIERLTK